LKRLVNPGSGTNPAAVEAGASAARESSQARVRVRNTQDVFMVGTPVKSPLKSGAPVLLLVAGEHFVAVAVAVAFGCRTFRWDVPGAARATVGGVAGRQALHFAEVWARCGAERVVTVDARCRPRRRSVGPGPSGTGTTRRWRRRWEFW